MKKLNQKTEKVLELREMARNHIFPFRGGGLPAPLSTTLNENNNDDGMVTHMTVALLLPGLKLCRQNMQNTISDDEY